MSNLIPYNKPYMTGKELWYVSQAHHSGQLAGDGKFTERCRLWLEQTIGCKKALMTHSCTAALEMAAILLNAQPGDEVIMPSYTFVSTANAFVLQDLVPVFVDIREDTLNLDESLVEKAITDKTRAIVPVHYAGIGCEMDALVKIASAHNLMLIEDAAQGIFSSYQGKPLGSFGGLATLSFHETKNVISGEGGALLINDERLIERAEIIREKGTNRSKFFRGQVDKYTWVDVGSSYLCGELICAFLYAQLEESKKITEERLKIWKTYHSAFESLESEGKLRRPTVPNNCSNNGHIYYLILNSLEERTKFIKFLSERNIKAVFHYVPLHNSPAGKKYTRTYGNLSKTEHLSECLVRLPMWMGLESQPVIEAVYNFFEKNV
ncbi:dTDP-4-amino-4,6-dideoxygalactose transaminase [Okeania sp.]|uniref:dTDP-4-amino-4,6-dideoxygalactose transaminase n=1 Tax=Okeania sp. TaxID=3100323 RepID=UPI002B4AD874|nr:dTDP-4-amino-4,6-dideoxygalactose transaminase [Okeania sp.]MEB3341294.1 dTDP-4-amino-4,6-dideoxygalactose transaminase [Okeania sp.]